MSARPHQGELEALLQRALAPVEPPEHLAVRMEEHLTTISLLAADELDAWELDVLHDPRTWVRPVAAVAVGTAAAGAAALLQARRRRGRRSAARAPEADPIAFAVGALRTIADQVGRRLTR
ncbi:MAG TPA: hypothetical protein VMT10_09165 [Solirubrobacteraceae bacterium]|nr:hypothetical protein [Solirubrobacteraceae bacterium]